MHPVLYREEINFECPDLRGRTGLHRHVGGEGPFGACGQGHRVGEDRRCGRPVVPDLHIVESRIHAVLDHSHPQFVPDDGIERDEFEAGSVGDHGAVACGGRVEGGVLISHPERERDGAAGLTDDEHPLVPIVEVIAIGRRRQVRDARGKTGAETQGEPVVEKRICRDHRAEVPQDRDLPVRVGCFAVDDQEGVVRRLPRHRHHPHPAIRVPRFVRRIARPRARAIGVVPIAIKRRPRRRVRRVAGINVVPPARRVLELHARLQPDRSEEGHTREDRNTPEQGTEAHRMRVGDCREV